MAEVDASEELVHERLDGGRLQGSSLALCIHVALEVTVHKLEYEHKFVFGVDNIVKGDDILVLELFHQGDFSNGGRRCALL